MPYRRPSIEVIQEFQSAAVAMALPSLPACVIGPGFQIKNDVSAGLYAGAVAEYEYPGLAAGAVVDISATPTTDSEVNIHKAVSVTLKDAYIIKLDGGTGGKLDNVGLLSYFIETGGAFSSLSQDGIDGRRYYVDVVSGTHPDGSIAGNDLNRNLVIGRSADNNTLRVARSWGIGGYGESAADVEYRVLEFREEEKYSYAQAIANGIVISASGVTLPDSFVTRTDVKEVLEAEVLLSFRALRPDLANKLTVFTDLASLVAIFGVGSIVPANVGAFAISLALQNTTTSVSFCGLGADYFGDEELAYQGALDFLEAKNVYALALLTNITAIHQAAKAHVDGMSLSKVGRERVCMISRKLETTAVEVPSSGIGRATSSGASNGVQSGGLSFLDPTNGAFIIDSVAVGYFLEIQSYVAAGGTPTAAHAAFITGTRHVITTVNSQGSVSLAASALGGFTGTLNSVVYRITRDLTRDEEATLLAGYSSSLGSRRVISVWPDVLAVSVGGVVTAIPGYFACAVLAGMTAGLQSWAGFTNLSIVGFVGREHSDDRYNDAQLDEIAGGGTMVLTQPIPAAALVVRHQLTTDVSTIYFQEFSVTKNIDMLARFFRALYAPFIGVYNITDGLLDMMKTRGEGGISYLKNQRVSRIGSPIRRASLSSISESAVQPDTVEIGIDVDVPLPLNNIKLTLLV